MFRHMRLKENQLPQEDAERIMREQPHGVLAVEGDGGYSYAVPLSYAYKGGKIYFHGATEGHKYDAAKKSSKVSFCVISKDDILPAEFNTLFESAIAFGKLRILESDEERMEALIAILEKYSPEHMESGKKYIEGNWDEVACFAIDVEHLTGKFGTPE